MELLLDIASYVFWVLLAITILVFVHEMGHFLTAKMFGMRVDRFSIGFPPIIAGKKIGETEYVIGATPLGGYVKIAGMIDESLDTGAMGEEPQPHEYRAKPVWQRIVVITAGVVFNVILAAVIFTGLKWAYGEQYVPAENVKEVYVSDGSIAHEMGLRTGDRIVAVSGRPLERFSDYMNPTALLADSLTITVERAGQQKTFAGPDDIMTQLTRAEERGFGISPEPAVIGGVVEGTPADSIGLQAGDRIVAVNGEKVQFWGALTDAIQRTEGRPFTLRWRRPDSLVAEDAPAPAARAVGDADALPALAGGIEEGRIYQARVRPERDDEGDRYVLGIYDIFATPALLEQEFGVRSETYSLPGAVNAGLEQTWETTVGIAESLRRVFTGRDNFRENVGGPVAIAKVTKEAAERGARFFWRIVAFLSITLAIMNILPIPALDGGHLMFLIYEGITRREPSARVRLALQQIGMVVLLVFMAFVIFNDILRW